MKTDSIGTCKRCGYTGPGPKHDCPTAIVLTAEEIKMAKGWDCTPLEFWTCCNQKKVIDHYSRGVTVGGLDVVGGLLCTVCGKTSICKGITREASATDSAWTLAKGGRSVNCGAIRLRAESTKVKAADIEALMLRIVRLPELEAELERLRATTTTTPTVRGVAANPATDPEWHTRHLKTCGTAFRGCDPECPKELAEREMAASAEPEVEPNEIVDGQEDYPEDALEGVDPMGDE